MITINVNGESQRLDIDPGTPLLWVVRENLGLTGTKFGCGIAQCGACTVHLNGQPIRACVTPVAAADGQSITTIEGVAVDGDMHPIQEAWIAEQVPQCGYCQSGQIMSAVALLRVNSNPTRDEVRMALSGNLCRCGAYDNYTNAVMRAAQNAA